MGHGIVGYIGYMSSIVGAGGGGSGGHGGFPPGPAKATAGKPITNMITNNRATIRFFITIGLLPLVFRISFLLFYYVLMRACICPYIRNNC